MKYDGTSPLRRIALIGSYLPRHCGIATFTSDLSEALGVEYPDATVFAVAVSDTEDGYNYPRRVWFEIEQKDISSYGHAADFLNENADLVCLQHEYGIYGGAAGSHVVSLLRKLRLPIVTTLHTILREPTPDQRGVMEELNELSDRLVVLSRRSAEILQETYKVLPGKIDFIPHGVHDMSLMETGLYKQQLGFAAKFVLLTFGLLSPDKGIEYVIESLPAILARFTNVVYIVLGATHPNVKRREDESYRHSLQRLAAARGVEENVIFHNRFISLEELRVFIAAADICITPYLKPEQVVSGTLAYLVAAGKAVVSTRYWYAEELLSENRGVLVTSRDPAAIADGVLALLNNDGELEAIRRRAYLQGREMVWSKVAPQYMASFLQARDGWSHHPRITAVNSPLDKRPFALPALNLQHLLRLTDDTGILQHANFTVPNYTEGYTTDDNARALIVSILLERVRGQVTQETRELASRYMAFLWYAFNHETGRFRNVLGYDRRWQEQVGSEESHGQALWGLGTVLGHSQDTSLQGLSNRLFDVSLLVTMEFSSPRAWALTLIGIDEYLMTFSGHRTALEVMETLAERLMELYRQHRSPDWLWFEDRLTYLNAKLPHALLLAGQRNSRRDMVEVGLEALGWLAAIQRSEEGHFVPIGNNGFYPRGGQKAQFDQQPVEAHAMASACLAAYRVTSVESWRKEAQRAFEWFLGRNDLSLPLYDPTTGGCRDGLHPDRANQNQGAESTLTFLISLLEMHLAYHPLHSSDQQR